MNTEFQQLRKAIFADGSIHEADAKLLRETMFADGGMNREKADFLFEIKDSVSRKKSEHNQHRTFGRYFCRFNRRVFVCYCADYFQYGRL
jgi:hypothetical protein